MNKEELKELLGVLSAVLESVAEPGVWISVYNCRAVVVQEVRQGAETWYEPATNWRDLEEEAIAAVEEAGGGITLSGRYPCPAALALRAVWKEEK